MKYRWFLCSSLVVLGLSACAKENFYQPRETAEVALIKIVASSGDNACTKLLQMTNFRSNDLASGGVIHLTPTESGRLYKNYKDKCYKLVGSELKKVKLKLPQIKLKDFPKRQESTF
jgi:hypothetical protein